MNHSQKGLQSAVPAKLNLLFLFHVLCSVPLPHFSHDSSLLHCFLLPPTQPPPAIRTLPIHPGCRSWFLPEADHEMKMFVWEATLKRTSKEWRSNTGKEVDQRRVLC